MSDDGFSERALNDVKTFAHPRRSRGALATTLFPHTTWKHDKETNNNTCASFLSGCCVESVGFDSGVVVVRLFPSPLS